MDGSIDDVRGQLIERRQRIEGVMATGGRAHQLEDLIAEIDQALERVSAGTYGRCETCGDAIEPDRLAADPLVRFCIDHLSPSEARALEQDLDLAGRVQESLLPARQLAAHGWDIAYHYEPLGVVSGDYCDLVRPADGGTDVYFLVGDISGKGVAASMLMAHLHASVRTLLGLGLPLPQVVERANRVFCDSTMSNHYATLVCGRLAADGTAEICNAGHCSPLVVCAGEVATVESTSVPVGLFCVGDYPVTRLHLSPGDTLLLYTDGVTEAFNRDDEEYGTGRLSAALAAHALEAPAVLVDACLRDVHAFRAGARRTDDVTIMAVRRTR
jgi:phosphoserine phosphatase RsbU/P